SAPAWDRARQFSSLARTASSRPRASSSASSSWLADGVATGCVSPIRTILDNPSQSHHPAIPGQISGQSLGNPWTILGPILEPFPASPDPGPRPNRAWDRLSAAACTPQAKQAFVRTLRRGERSRSPQMYTKSRATPIARRPPRPYNAAQLRPMRPSDAHPFRQETEPMAQVNAIKVFARARSGTGGAREVRRQALVPAIVYGNG